jgi:2-polyprenyl-3-methyl-5-hydroxy-6-metoxy-1,4-benzoquinol methylase
MTQEKIIYDYGAREDIAVFVPPDVKTLLDVGCGHGKFLRLIKDQTGAETWGVELLPWVAEKAKEQADHVITGKIEEALPLLPDHYFDCITFNDVLEHLLEPEEILKKIKPKLTDKGMIIASIPNVRYFYNLVEVVIKKDWEYKESGTLDATHLRFFTKKSIQRMFENAGYDVVLLQGINKISYWKFRLLNMVTLGLLNDTKYVQYACVAKETVSRNPRSIEIHS